VGQLGEESNWIELESAMLKSEPFPSFHVV
jgi:hypothetical protein